MSTLKRKASNEQTSDSKKAKQNGSITSFFSTTVTPKNSEPSAKTAAAFDKEKWAASLTDEQRQLLQLEIDTLHESWLALLKDDIVTKEFLDLKRFLHREMSNGRRWFPPKEDVYSWSRHCPFDKVKVVILGQDPYHNDNQAHGLAFSVRPPTPAPPSLRNIYIALQKDYPTFTPPPERRGLLTPWADRGVLLLNACLTVRAHEANSHSNRGWERFTQRVIELAAARRSKGVVFIAWGSPAARRVVKIDQTRHLVLKSVHPSPLSASRGFFDCGHFRKANEWLIQRYGAKAEIDWDLGGGGGSTLMVKKVEVETELAKTAVAEKEVEEKDGKVEEGKKRTVEVVKVGVHVEAEEVKVTA
ncbi:hypothetical protein ACRALDRAFT_1082596 [Sodiomyces alcalophilus JCM 7366]|uniref:uncharacterized protein n=1 Tax=Sodiomyces alcalophilus JCM 7366 TaxID=591952 RepID=UPI0039B6BBBA